MNLNKDPSSWAAVNPKAVVAGSAAQAANVLQMALEDIARLDRENDRLRATLRSGMDLAHGLCCPGCTAQGRGMAAPGKCCRDADCDAGWYGIHCDEVKSFLDAAEALMPEMLSELENPHHADSESEPHNA